MDYGSVLELTRQGVMVGLMVTLPILGIALFIGVGVSVFQAMTQVQELTLTFVPKLIGAALVMVLLGGWMVGTLVQFVRFCFEHAAAIGA